ncbi:MAG: acyl-CoA/acyl-ACP dehydrogenase [Bacteriovoracaceae bacterium]|nr:acyl-CoA/acyl-ACP dehydrogenase [Bacteriovoracaceae bacterium]
MKNYYSDNSEWQWLLKNAIDWKAILPLYYPKYPTEEEFQNEEEVISFIHELLSTIGDWAGGAVKNRARDLDQQGAGKVEDGKAVLGEHLQQLYKEARELEFFGLTAPRSFGGMEMPYFVILISLSMLSRSCQASSTQLSFYTSIIDMIDRFCDKETRQKYIPQIIAGKLSGAMCLTEPGAGSDVGVLRTVAERQDDGTYLLTGTKCFITNGGGGLGFVLARLKDAPEGLSGISMFFVEEWIGEGDNRKHNYTIGKNEDKMGFHGSFTCEVIYEKSVAHIVGAENEGFQYMLHLMNEARIAVGMQGLGGIEACCQVAREYAGQRVQFQKPIEQLPLLKRLLYEMEVERDAFRALMVDTIIYFDIYQRLDIKKRHDEKLSEEEEKLYKEAMKWTRRRTPLVKYYGAECYTKLSTKAIQVLGGYGYMKEYDAERLHRDSFGPLLYEGTSQIQSLMAMKDLIKFTFRNPTKFLQTMFFPHQASTEIFSDVTYDGKFAKVHYRFKKNIAKLFIKTLKPDSKDLFNSRAWQSAESFEKMMMHAETICEGLSYIETLRVLSRHANKDKGREKLFDQYRMLIIPRLEHIYSDWQNFKCF